MRKERIVNPAAPGGTRPATFNVTDRALRYRANARPPEGPKVCHYCGSTGAVEVEHVDGHEENTDPRNLAWACRSCNTRKGAVFARAGIGRLTRQYNPSDGARGPGQYAEAVNALMGRPAQLTARQAVAVIHGTPHQARAKFAGMIRENPDQVPTFEQYKFGVSTHDKKTHAHDEGGAIIHATPPALRREYAQRIAEAKRRRGTTRRAGRRAGADEVPF